MTEPAVGATASTAVFQGPNWRDRLDVPIYEVQLWPHQSMTPTGLRTVMAITAAFLCFPLLSVVGTAVFWGLLPFMALAFFGLYFAICRNGRNMRISETLSVWRDEVRVERKDPNGRVRRWMAAPLDVRVRLHKDAQIEDYLTLSGGGREIELGAFLAPEERISLADELDAALTKAIRG
ncbi:MAG: DUF2244 domain-containing protein [Pseudomonadota bacterium]